MLFNKDNRGSEELYQISGIFQASADYNSIAAEVDAATAEVDAIIGSTVVADAEEAYAKQVIPAAKQALVDAVRLPIAYYAIAMHAKLTGVTHGETGRKIKADDNEKIPFAWQLDRDDRELRERYYRALDALFRYLQGTNYAASINSIFDGAIIKKITDIETVYPLEHSFYMFYKLAPMILEIQNSKLKNIVGAANLAKLISGDASVADMKGPAMRFIVLRSMIIAIQRWSIDAFPLAIARRFAPNYQGNVQGNMATTDEIDWYLEKLNLQAQDAALDLQTILSGNPYESLDILPKNDKNNKYFTV